MPELITRFFDLGSLILVGGGSLLAAALRSTRGDLARAVRAVRPMLRAAPDRDRLAAERAVRQIERIAEAKGIACADRAVTEVAFVRAAALKLADTASADDFGAWAAEELDARAARHRSAAAVWRAAADASPTLGMIGTVLGLIGMFAAMDDPASMGPAMALAMLTTLYGLVCGMLLFGPAAARLEQLSAAELDWQRAVLARLEKLASAETRTSEGWLRRRACAAAG